jgi:hypothetical protein
LGITIDIEKSEVKNINIDFEEVISNRDFLGRYMFNWIKQPGVENFYSRLIINPHTKGKPNITSNESLTEAEEGVYNTNLVPFDSDIQLNLFY